PEFAKWIQFGTGHGKHGATPQSPAAIAADFEMMIRAAQREHPAVESNQTESRCYGLTARLYGESGRGVLRVAFDELERRIGPGPGVSKGRAGSALRMDRKS